MRIRGTVVGRIILAASVALAVAPGVPPQAFAADAPGSVPGAQYLADRLVDDARSVTRDSQVAPELAAQQAAILLQFAHRLSPTDLHTLKLLAEAARAAGKSDVEKDALRKIITADPSDFVAQVQFLDLVANASQALDDRARIYQAAYDQPTLNPQIRSEMAMRLARIALERGDEPSARNLIQQAIGLNSVNIPALRAMAELSTSSITERIAALLTLLSTNPCQPAAWLRLARYLEAVNVHDRAADFLLTAIEQTQLQDGAPAPAELYLELGTELAIAGRMPEAAPILYAVAKLPDAPLGPMLAAQLLGAQKPEASSATRPSDTLGADIEKRLADLAAEGTPAALADAITAELTILPNVGADTEKWLATYAGQVTADDATLARLRGWLLYRQGKTEEATAALQALKDSDPMAQLGLARIQIDQGKNAEATARLQQLWSNNPTGLLAMQVAGLARTLGVTLADPPQSKQLREQVARVTPLLTKSHQQTRDSQFVNATFRRTPVGIGEAVIISMRIKNTSGRPLPVGADGVIPTRVGLTATIRGSTSQPQGRPLGLIVLEDIQRIYRLEPGGAMDANIRVDQGKLGTLLEQNPSDNVKAGVTLLTAPHVVELPSVKQGLPPLEDGFPGLGGQQVTVGDFDRAGYSVDTSADFQRLLTEIAGFSGERQLVRIDVGAVLLGNALRKQAASGGAAPATAALSNQKSLADALRAQLANPQALVRATVIRALPPGSPGPEMEQAVAAMAGDPDPLVRALWAGNQSLLASAPGDAAKESLALLKRRAEAETDPLVKEWMELMVSAVRVPPPATLPAVPPTTPAMMPASAPATIPGTMPLMLPATMPATTQAGPGDH